MSHANLRSLLLTILCALSLCLHVHAGEPLRTEFAPPITQAQIERARGQMLHATAPRLPAAIVVDGLLQDAAWTHAAKLLPSTTGTEHTDFLIGHDGQRLCIAVRTQQPAGVGVRGQPAAYNVAKAWRDDCVELHIGRAEIGQVAIHQFVVNAAGARIAIRPSDNPQATLTYGLDENTWAAATHVEGDQWTAEFSFTPAALGLERWPAELVFNISRGGPAPVKGVAWGPAYGQDGIGILALDGIPKEALASSTAAVSAVNRVGSNVATIGPGLELTLDRPALRPGARWVEARVRLAPAVPLAKCKVRVELFGAAADKPVSSTETTPTVALGRVSVDLRALQQSAGQLVVSLLEDGKLTAIARAPVWAEPNPDPIPPGHRIALQVDAAPQTGPVTDFPVRFGVPFPEGALWDVNDVRLIDSTGKSVPATREIATRWARDGALKWVLFDAQVSSGKEYFVEFAHADAKAALATTVTVQKTGDDRVTVDTGAAKYLIAKGPAPITAIEVAGKQIVTSQNTRGLYVVDQTGRVASASADGESLLVESASPVAACIRLEGFYRSDKGDPVARHITRIELFAGHAQAKVTHTLILVNDTNQVWLKEVGWELATTAGANPRALFATEREKPAQIVSSKLDAKGASVFMLQESHYRFLGGANRSTIQTTDAAGKNTLLHEGAECGDWAALTSDSAGLLIACRDAARQHPKEFAATANTLVLKLFSNRTGEELDFRSPALAKKWNVAEWFKHSNNIRHQTNGQTMENALVNVEKIPSNAIGWAKTHELVIAPLTTRADDAIAKTAVRIAGTLTFPVFVNVDPQWIYRSDALGPLHPKDIKRFPEAEDVLSRTIAYYQRRDNKTGLYGIMDYGTGPMQHPSFLDDEIADPERYRWNGNFRRDLLLQAARSGERDVREFAELVSRAAYDFSFTHWDGPQRVKGGWLSVVGTDHTAADKTGLPYWWESVTDFDPSATSEPDDVMILYYLTGNRRAKDVADAYFVALKEDWSPARVRRQFFVLRYLAQFILAYEFTMDPQFDELTRATLDLIYDPQAKLRLGQYIYTTTYKVNQEVSYLIDGARLIDDPRLEDLAVTRCNYLNDEEPGQIVGYRSAQGSTTSYLYRRNPEPYIGENTALLLRQLGRFYDPKQGILINTANIVANAARASLITTGLMFGQDAVVRSNADQVPLASWAGAGFPVASADAAAAPAPAPAPAPTPAYGCIYVRKSANRALVLRGCGTGVASRNEVQVKFMEKSTGFASTELNKVDSFEDTANFRITLEKFAPEGTYRVTGTQQQFVIADQKAPLVLYAPGPWKPAPEQRPWVHIYFKVPADAAAPQIHFEGQAALFDPAGKPFNNGQPLTGDVNLPAATPGLWSFVPIENKQVQVRNIPPYFAFRDPSFYFEPVLTAEAP